MQHLLKKSKIFCIEVIVLFFQTGMDQRLWKQAQADNPDPENYIPVPMIGFSEVSDIAEIIQYKLQN